MKKMLLISIMLLPFIAFGQAWIQVPIPTSSDINDVSFYSEDNGWLVGNNGLIARFQNQSWQILPPPNSFNLNAIHPVDSNKAWIVGGNSSNIILLYDNGIYYDYTPSNSAWINDIYMLDSTGWCAGNGRIFFFDGNQWIDTTASGFNKEVLDIDFYGTTGFMVGDFPSVLISTNGFQDSVTGWTSFNTCVKAVSDTSYLLGRMHNVMGTGHTWILQFPGYITLYYTPNPIWMKEIYLHDHTGWAVGQNYILRFDSTSTQFVLHQTTSKTLNCMEMLSDTSGWIGGRDGLLLSLTTQQSNIEDYELPTFKIFPNPALDEIWITQTEINQGIQIFDVYGRLCMSISPGNSEQPLVNISKLKPGIYLVLVKYNTRWMKSIFIKGQ